MIEHILSDPLTFWLFAGFVFVLLVQLIYFWGYFSRLAFYKEIRLNDDLPPVSVVLTASNQYNDLQKNLEHFLNQDYPGFEVVVVIDNSDDGTDELLTDFSKKYEHLHIVELKQKLNWFSGRKFALSLGIKSAKFSTILLSDPACRPESKNWISEMVSGYRYQTEIVLGYSTYHTGSKINRWLRFAAFYDALFYLSMAIAGKPFKGIGKNLSYSRDLFYSHKGFSSHYAINAGDDELFVNRASRKLNTEVRVSPHSRVLQVRPLTFAKWLKLEQTRLRIRGLFKFRDRFIIRLFSFTAFVFFGLFAALLILGAPWLLVLIVFGLRLISQMVIFALAGKKLKEENLWLLSPLFEILIILIDLMIWISILWKPGSNRV